MKNFLNIIAIVCLIISICLLVVLAIFYERIVYPDWINYLLFGVIVSFIFIIFILPSIRREHARKVEKPTKRTYTITDSLKRLSSADQERGIERSDGNSTVSIPAVKNQNVDVAPIDATNTDTKGNRKNDKGIFDTSIISHVRVDYECPLPFVQGDNWNYAVAKFPEKGCIVFPHRKGKIARRGHMEEPLQEYLEKQFKESQLEILDNCAILPADNYRPYEPDIAIVDLESPSIRIDIEIDEPYAAITNKPIHYIGCDDDFRDMNLNNLGWIVVRFTEYQVKLDSLGCASFIAQLLHSLNPSKHLPDLLLRHNGPEPQKRWTEIEAKVMASEKFREKYLNHTFGSVDTEKIEIDNIKQTEVEKSYAELVKPLIFNRLPKNTADASPAFDRDNNIQFLPQGHIYIYNGRERFTPVSSVISCFFKPFDSFSQSAYDKAIKRNIPHGQLLEEWDEKGACSREVGTFMHQQIENYYNGNEYQTEYRFKYDGKYIQSDKKIDLKNEYNQFINFVKDHNFEPFRTEWTIYDERLKIAGTIDMIHKNGDVFDIYDWKRSQKVVDDNGDPIIRNDYGKVGLEELGHIDDTSYWHYCIQQNIYRYILEKNYNVKVGKMYLVVFRDNANKYIKLTVPTMDNVIVAIVEACKKGRLRRS